MILHEMMRQFVDHDGIDDVQRKVNQYPIERQQMFEVIILPHAGPHVRDFHPVGDRNIHDFPIFFDPRTKNVFRQRFQLPVGLLAIGDHEVLPGDAALPRRQIDEPPPDSQHIDVLIGDKRRRMQPGDFLFIEDPHQHFFRLFQGVTFFQRQIEMTAGNVDLSCASIGRFDIQNHVFSVKRNDFRFFHLNHQTLPYIIVREKKNQIRRKIMEKILISHCLLGKNCKWNGKSNWNEKIASLKDKYELIPICPEVFGGLPTPRIPSEIIGDRVYNQILLDVTARYKEGAEEALRIAEKDHVRYAILKERSPSCGVHWIYDGTFQRKTIEGSGIAARLLKAHGIEVFSDEEIEKMMTEQEDQR